MNLWIKKIIASFFWGAVHAGGASMSLALAKGSGMDVPALNWKALGIIMLGSGLVQMFSMIEKFLLPFISDDGAQAKLDNPKP